MATKVREPWNNVRDQMSRGQIIDLIHALKEKNESKKSMLYSIQIIPRPQAGFLIPIKCTHAEDAEIKSGLLTHNLLLKLDEFHLGAMLGSLLGYAEAVQIKIVRDDRSPGYIIKKVTVSI